MPKMGRSRSMASWIKASSASSRWSSGGSVSGRGSVPKRLGLTSVPPMSMRPWKPLRESLFSTLDSEGFDAGDARGCGVRHDLLLVAVRDEDALAHTFYSHNNERVRYLLILLLMQPQVELKDKLYGRFSPTTDVTADRVSYATEYGMRVPAIVYHRAGATINLHPGLIIIAKDKSYSYAAGIVYARAGAVVLTFDPIGEFERDWQKRSGVALPDDGMAQRRAELMQMDIAQGTRYLASRKDVDPKHIAVD